MARLSWLELGRAGGIAKPAAVGWIHRLSGLHGDALSNDAEDGRSPVGGPTGRVCRCGHDGPHPNLPGVAQMDARPIHEALPIDLHCVIGKYLRA